MLIIKNSNKCKYKYIALHYNEIFLNDTLKMLHSNGINLQDMLPYNINTNYDYFLFKFVGDLPTDENRLNYIIECVYSKVKFVDLVREYDNFLYSKGFDRTITENVFFLGGLNG